MQRLEHGWPEEVMVCGGNDLSRDTSGSGNGVSWILELGM